MCILARELISDTGTRAELDESVQQWVVAHPQGTIVMSAAINDYEVAGCMLKTGNEERMIPQGDKVPSGADAVHIVLQRAPKLVDQLADWGHRGALVVFKYEASETVIASAQRLRERVGSCLAVANSLDGSIQAITTDEGVVTYDNRESLLNGLAEHISGVKT